MMLQNDLQTTSSLVRHVQRLLVPKPRRTPVQWAEAERRFPGSSPEPGKYHANRLPYQIEPTLASIDPTVLETVMLWARQTGKSTVVQSVIGYLIDEDPCSILVVYPTKDGATNYMRRHFSPMVRSSPSLRGKVTETRFKSAEATVLNRPFPGGHLAAVGSESASGLRQMSFRVVMADEVDSYSLENPDGDPLALAVGRADAFHNSIVYILSTPTYKSTSRIQARFDRTDKRYWFVPCPKCQHYQILKWSNVRWTWVEDGVEKSDPTKAYYECDNLACKHHWTDADRLNAIARGQWRATAPFLGFRGYHLSGLYRCVGKKTAYKSYLHQFAAEFLVAKHEGKETLRQWTNQFLAECWTDETETVEASPLMQRRETYEKLPPEALVLLAGVDLQQDRWEAEVVAFGDKEISWGVEYVVQPGNPQDKSYWMALDAFLSRTYVRDDGLKMGIISAGVDSGFRQELVLPWCAERSHLRIYAVRGSSEHNLPILSGNSRSSATHLPFWSIGTDSAKHQIYHRLLLSDPTAPGYCHFRGDTFGYTSVYFDMLTSHEFTLKMLQGKPKRNWQKKHQHTRDESLDCRVYIAAMLVLLNPQWQIIKEGQDSILAAEKKQAGSTPVAIMPGVRTGSFLG